ncbi:hypothetical protein FSP39_018723 [Pinctada imbricata]|uniref:Uncharacterized protein n=1 Tax=Pinctada imbricata TaxID=66713 RepID=A0AA89BTA7_PINIB|nr:hypothetical protein FSP39_018723 [Pinctada imbricata]
MADSKFLDDLTQCPICFNQYQRPRCLPCLHTFCEKCVDEYIASIEHGKEKDSGFNCPVCRHFINAPSAELGESKWAQKFPMNYLVLTLIDQKSLQEGKLYCNPCKKKSKSEKSVAWCIQCKISLCTICADFHTSVPILENHEIVPFGENKDETRLVSSAHIMCGIHQDKPIEMYCLDHDIPCCSTCTMVTHRKCEHVDTLENVAEKSKTSSVRVELEEGFAKQLETVEENLRNDAKNVDILRESCQKAKSKVNQESEDAVKHMKYLTDNAISEVRHLQEKKEDTLTGALEMNKGRKATIENCQKLLRILIEQSSDIQFFLESKKLRRKLDELTKDLSELQSIQSSDVIFSYEVRKEISEMVRYDSLGQITYENADKPDPNQNVPFNGTSQSSGVPVECLRQQEEKFPAFTLDDSKQIEIEARRQNSSVTGCTFLEDGRLVIADYKIRKAREGIIKIYDKDFDSSQVIPLKGKPWAVATLNSSFIIVTIPHASEVLILDTVTFSTKETISSERMYFGLAVQNPLTDSSTLSEEDRDKCTMVASSKGDLFLIHLNGKTLKQFTISDSYIRYVACSQGEIFCGVDKKVICIDESDQILFEFFDTQLQKPTGMVVTKDNHIVVCDYDGGKVFVFDSDGFKRQVLLVKPDACFPALNKDQDKLCVITGGPSVVNKAQIYNVNY